MSLTVTLNIYSGRPNPVWTLPEEASADLNERITRATTLSDLKASAVGGLGYRGFTVQGSDYGVSPTHIHAGIIDHGHSVPSLIADDRELEKWLLSTAGAVIDDEVRAHVEQRLAEPIASAVSRLALSIGRCPVCHAPDAPPYNPAMWNTPTVQPYNNCYNYANNQITNTFAQPGRATGHPITSLSCKGVVPSAQSDGLVPCANFSGALEHGWYVAVVIWPGRDYHWYRQDKSGCWSHKPGSTAARATDNSGKSISDPKTADRGPYTDFCTYMITNTRVRIK